MLDRYGKQIGLGLCVLSAVFMVTVIYWAITATIALATPQYGKVGYCHATGSATNPYVYVYVSENSAHKNHSGDYLASGPADCETPDVPSTNGSTSGGTPGGTTPVPETTVTNTTPQTTVTPPSTIPETVPGTTVETTETVPGTTSVTPETTSETTEQTPNGPVVSQNPPSVVWQTPANQPPAIVTIQVNESPVSVSVPDLDSSGVVDQGEALAVAVAAQELAQSGDEDTARGIASEYTPEAQKAVDVARGIDVLPDTAGIPLWPFAAGLLLMAGVIGFRIVRNG